MKKIALVVASAGLMALAACGETPANETANASNVSNAVVENVVENAANAVENAADNTQNAANAVENSAANAM